MLMICSFIYHLSQAIQYLDNIYTAISQVKSCINDTKTWMTNNLSKQKDDKTERISITTSDTTRHQEDIVINIGDSPISPSMEPPKNLGWMTDITY